MNHVRLRHPVTGATYDAPEAAVAQYARSGWVRDDEIQAAAVDATPTGDPTPTPDETEKSPRGRRSSKEN